MFLNLLHETQNSVRNVSLHCFWVGSAFSEPSKNWPLTCPGNRGGLPKHITFLSNCKNFQIHVLHDWVFNFLAHFQSSHFHLPSRMGWLLRPIFHLVFGGCSIAMHSQHPFTNNLCSSPFFFFVKHLMTDWCFNLKIHVYIWIDWFMFWPCCKLQMDWAGTAHNMHLCIWTDYSLFHHDTALTSCLSRLCIWCPPDSQSSYHI